MEKKLDRGQPVSIEGEQGVLGSMLLSAKWAIPRAVTAISEKYFYTAAHRTIFSEAVAMFQAREPVDLVTFTNRLRKAGKLVEVGGPSVVTSLFTFVPTAANLNYYLGMVIDAYRRRQIIEGCTRAISMAHDQSEDIPAAKKVIWEALRSTESRANESRTDETVREVTQMIYARQIGTELGILTGIPAWDKALHGIFKKRFYVVGSRPKIGKTAMIEQSAQMQNANGIPVLIFERDMSLTDLIGRMACRTAGVIFDHFLTGVASTEELEKVRTCAAAIDPKLLRLYSPANLNAEELTSIIEREIQDYGIQVWYLDLFQRLKTGATDRVEGLTAAANQIRDVIQSTGVPGVVIAEILKDADKTKRPHSGQFKYCDGLFSSCDTSILLWTDDDPKDLIISTPDGEIMRRQKVIFTVDANRGPVGDEVLWFDRPQMKFYDEPSDEDEL